MAPYGARSVDDPEYQDHSHLPETQQLMAPCALRLGSRATDDGAITRGISHGTGTLQRLERHEIRERFMFRRWQKQAINETDY